jgi:hypothetical protein
LSEVIAAISAAVTTGLVVATNLYVMWLCREASREGRAVQARFGMLPSVEIEGRHHGIKTGRCIHRKVAIDAGSSNPEMRKAAEVNVS